MARSSNHALREVGHEPFGTPVAPAASPSTLTFPVILGVALLAFVHAFTLLAPILLSFLLIVLVSLAINPVIFRVRALTGGRISATGLVAIAFLMVLALTALAFFGPMKSSVAKLASQLPVYWERLQRPLVMLEQQAEQAAVKLKAEVTAEIALTKAPVIRPEVASPIAQPPRSTSTNEAGTLRGSLSDMLRGVTGRFTALAFDAAQILVVLVTVFFGVTFASMNPRPIFGAMFSVIPARHHAHTVVIFRRIGMFIPGWAVATLLGMMTIGVLVFLLMWPLFGVVDALVLGLIAGVLEAIPFLGPMLGAVPALVFAVGDGGLTPVWVVLAYGAIQGLENNVISPYILARHMRLHPVAVIFSMLLCVATFGVLGVLVAAPIVAIVSILHDELYRKRFLPNVTDADLDRLARIALSETGAS